MTDIVSSIVKRLSGTQTGLRPVTRSRFEPMTNHEPLPHEQAVEHSAANPTTLPSAPAANHSGTAKRRKFDNDITPGNTAATPAKEIAGAKDATAVSAVNPNRAPPPSAPIAPMPQREPVPPIDELSKVPASVVREKETSTKTQPGNVTAPDGTANERVIERETLTRVETRIVDRRSADASPTTQTGMRSEPSDARKQAGQPLVRPAQVQNAADHDRERRPVLRALTTAAQPLPSALTAPEAITESAPPAVRISIERLEVRVQPAKGAPVKNNHTVRSPAATDLDAFLNNLEGRR